MDEHKARELLKRYQNSECSAKEQLAIEKWIEQQLAAQSWNMGDEERVLFGRSLKNKIDHVRKQQEIAASADRGKIRFLTIGRSIAAAAILLIGLSAVVFFYNKNPKPQQVVQQDIAPGGNKATLTLSNGEKIVLANAMNGALASQGNARIIKRDDGTLLYDNKVKGDINTSGFNQINTPRGGQYQVVLEDGTKVWLNSASSLKYPAMFTGNERRVELTGEAYFEVAHNTSMPFKVVSVSQVVTVLGTHFNINAYTDEPSIKTTLLAGSVSLSTGNGKKFLKPGQQAVLGENTLAVSNADTDEVMAWKNGMFQFSGESLESIMRKISRWYDVDVEYADNGVKALPFTGVITHFGNISKVLRMLELTGQVHFKVEAKRIIVTK